MALLYALIFVSRTGLLACPRTNLARQARRPVLLLATALVLIVPWLAKNWIWAGNPVSPYDFACPGGVTEHVANLAERFISLGHEVHIVAPSSDDEAEPIARKQTVDRCRHQLFINDSGSEAMTGIR